MKIDKLCRTKLKQTLFKAIVLEGPGDHRWFTFANWPYAKEEQTFLYRYEWKSFYNLEQSTHWSWTSSSRDTARYVLSSLIAFQREGSGSWEKPSWVLKLLKGFQKLLNIKRAEKNVAVTSFLKKNPIDKRVSQVVFLQLLSPVQLFATLLTAACQASLSFTISWSLLKLMSIELVMPSNHLVLCCPLLLPSIFPIMRIFSCELALCIKWPKYWSFSFSPSNEYSGLISFRIEWFDLLAVRGTLKSLLYKSLWKHLLWKQHRCPLADKCIRKLWYTYTMEYYSAIKKNAFESVLMRWKKLEPIIQSKVRKKNTNTAY